MRLNTLSPAAGSKKAAKRVGRGIGCGSGKTCGRGHKGQHARAGGFHKVGFEGGQMPIQRRLPKVGFIARKARFNTEIRVHELNNVDAEVIDLIALKTANLIGQHIKNVKVIASGNLDKAVTIKGLNTTKGAKAIIESAGGKVE